MPYDGSGNFNRVHDWTADEGAGIKVRADRFDAENDDFATAFENCITRDGQGKPSANIDFNNKKITNLADATLLQDALNIRTSQQNAYSFGTTAGSANTYTLALGVTVASLVDGQPFRAEINVTNTGASTLNVDSIGAKTLQIDGKDLVGGELQANQIYDFFYNAGTDKIEIGKTSFATEAETITGTINTKPTTPLGVKSALSNSLSLFKGKFGLQIENDSGDTLHDIKVNNGICIDSTKTSIIDLSSSTIIKRIDATWQLGNGNGGFPTGASLNPNTSYPFFVISKADGTVDAGFDDNISATNLLADATGFIYFRRIGHIYTDGSSNILGFIQDNNLFRFKVMDRTADLSITPTAAVSPANLTIPTPIGIRAKAILFVELSYGVAGQNNTCYVAIWNSSLTDPATANANNSVIAALEGVSGDYGFSQQKICEYTNTSSQVRYRLDATSFSSAIISLKVTTQGWYDYFLD